MRRTALSILIAASAAAFLLIAAVTRSQGVVQPHPYTAAAWLAAILAFCVFAIMLAEYFIHRRQVHLYLAAAFLSLGIMGVWDALILPSVVVRAGDGIHPALRQAEWISLALMLIYGVAVSRSLSAGRHVAGASAVIVAGVLWAALVIFALSTFPRISSALYEGQTHIAISIVCGVIFALGSFVYSRASVHRGNAVLAWMSYGLVFAAFSQAANLYETHESYGLLFGFSSLMKVLVFLSPLAGMLAEHTRLQMKVHEQASELNNLIQAQQAAASIGPPAELFQRISELVSFSLSAGMVCLMPFDRERGLLQAAARVGLTEDDARRFVFRAGEGPAGECFSKRETVIVRNVFDDPVLSQKLAGTDGIVSAVFTPLIARNECLGVLALFFGGRPLQKISKEQTRLLDAFAGQAALALDGAQLRGRMVYSTRTSVDYARELEIVWEIGHAMASKLDLNALVDTLAGKLKEAVDATTCSVLVFEPDVGGLKVLGHRKLARYHSAGDQVDQCDLVAAMAARTGEPMAANDMPNTFNCKYSELATNDGGAHHQLSVPMSLPGFTGAISVFRQNTEPFGEREKRLLMRLAPMVATGIRNAELYEREKKIAESLQKSFLPDLDSDLPGIQIAHLYEAAYDESLVGGDFYDIIDIGEGRYGIAVGDVAGKGLDAAVYTAMSRYMIQAYSANDPSPVQVISQLNTALCRYTPVGKFVTLAYGVLDTASNIFTYVNAGHELPFVHKASDDELITLKSTGPAVGAIPEAEYSSEAVSFDPGDILIFYTDGATDARSEGKFLGTEGLRRIVLGSIRADIDRLPRAILDGVRSFASGHLRDDVAILAIKARTPGSLF